MIYKMIQLCANRDKPDAICKKTPEPPRCRGCKVDCSRFDRLMIPSAECNKRKALEEGANNE